MKTKISLNLGIGAMALGLLMASLSVAPAFGDECKNRGSLDVLYCDNDNDLVADPPQDASKWRDPSTLVFTYTPVEDPAVYRDAFKPFQDYLSEHTGKRVIYYTVQSNAAEIEAMRSGRLHVAGFSTGPTGLRSILPGRYHLQSRVLKASFRATV